MEQEPKNENLEPYDELVRLGEAKLIELFPDSSEFIKSKDGNRLVESFVGDVLDQNKMRSAFVFHNLNPEKQKAALEEIGVSDINTLFDDVSEDLVTFYKKKIKNPAKKVDVLDIAEDV